MAIPNSALLARLKRLDSTCRDVLLDSVSGQLCSKFSESYVLFFCVCDFFLRVLLLFFFPHNLLMFEETDIYALDTLFHCFC